MEFRAWAILIFLLLIFIGSFIKPKPDKDDNTPWAKEIRNMRRGFGLLIIMLIIGLIDYYFHLGF